MSPQGVRVVASTESRPAAGTGTRAQAGHAGHVPARPRARHPTVAGIFVFYAASVLAGGFGQGLALIPNVAITWWPPVGILLALLLLSPRASWAWWVLAAGLAELTCNALWFKNPLPLALVYFSGNALEALVAAALILRFGGTAFRLESPREFGAFVLFGAVLAPMISASVIAGTDAWIGKHVLSTAWLLVWLGDATGMLVSTPLTFVAVRAWQQRAHVPGPRQFEAALLAAALLTMAVLFLVGLLPTVYLMLPLLLWGAARFQLQGAAVGIGFVALVIAQATALGIGAFAVSPVVAIDGVVLLQTFLGICAICTLLVAAVSLEHRRVLGQLTRLNADLEARVAERTATLRDSQASLRRFLDTASTGLVRKSRDLRYVSANTAYAKLVGLPVPQIVGRSLAEVLGEASVEKVRPYIQRVLDGERVEFEAELPLAHAGARWLHIVYVPDRNDAGQIIGWVVSTQDVSERKAAEEELRQTAQRVQLATEATGVGIWEWDPTTGRSRWTAQMFRIYGIEPTADGFVAHDDWRRAVLPEDLPQQEATLAETVRSAGRSSREFRIRRRNDGEVRTLRSVETARTDARGLVRFVTGTTLDVTAARQIEATLKDADRRKDVFLATLSHELRNPLAPMKNALELIRRARGNTALIEQSRLVLERQMRQMERLVDDLLDVGRITHGKLELRPAPVDLALLLQQAIEAAQPHATRAGHRLEVVLPPEPIRLRADAVRLTQVFGNLLTNACKYTRPHGRIRIEAQRVGDEAVVTVADNGIGIAPEMLCNVFDMFTQASRPSGDSGGGLGIGLSLVRFIVELHGGRVTAHSEGVDRGSVFTVRLPALWRDEVAVHVGDGDAGRDVGSDADQRPEFADTEGLVDEPVPDNNGSVRAGHGLAPGQRVLVVDDNHDSAQTLAELLRLGGCETRMAHDGEAAVEVARQFRPQVILMDIGLPKQDGHAACRAIRGEPWSAGTVIVAVTGWGQDEDRRLSSEAGFDGHLVKPVDLPTLGRLLAAAGPSGANVNTNMNENAGTHAGAGAAIAAPPA